MRVAIRRGLNSAGCSDGCCLRQLVPALLLTAGLSTFPARSRAAEPLCDWLDGLGAAAQARLDGSPDAERHARRAIGALPAGLAGARARLELGLSPGAGQNPVERASALRAGSGLAAQPVRGAILAALGDALLAAGDPRGALEAFRGAAAEGTSAAAARARWRAAEALHAGGFATEAVAAWRPLLGDPLATHLETAQRLAYALDLHATGERRRAVEILRSLWSAQPERPESAAAEEALARWRAAGDGSVPPFTGEERVARAYRLIATGRVPEARRELTLAQATRPAPRADLLALAEAAALLATGRPGDAARAVEPYARSPDAGVRRGVSLIAARAASRERRMADAMAAWRAVAASDAAVPGLTPPAQASLHDDAEYFAAWLHLDSGDPANAAAALDRLARLHPGSRRADDARWFAAWALLRTGATDAAEAALRRLDEGSAAPRVRYWRARIEPDPARSAALLQSVIAADPLGYYGLLACTRLRAAGASCAPPPLAAGPPPPELDGLPEAPRLRAAAALAAAGLRDEAVAELEAIAGANGGRRAAPAAAELAAFLGDPLLPFRLARDQLGLSRRSLPWSFPDAWPAIVEPSARAAGVDPSLLRAVMRRESGFRTQARSAAGAVGLLQIIPSTAARLSALLAFPAPLAEQLEDPAVNVPLGAGYLALLLERFGDPLVAIAAYNAGPGAVARWSRERTGLPLDVWVESIPFRETRQYVRAVVENWVGARAAAGAPPPAIDPDRRVPVPADGIAF